MIGELKVVAIIPARGGSKALPKKNIVDLCGKPLIAHTIKAALESKYIDRVIVSTDNDEISSISRKYGAEVPFKRPKHLSTDKAHTHPVIEHAAKFLESKGYYGDLFVTLQPTSPLRKAVHIDKAIELMHNSEFDVIISVKPIDFPPYWALKLKGNKAIPFVKDGVRKYFKKERQQLPKTYQTNGAIYVANKQALYVEKVVISRNSGVLIMDDESSLDVDTYMDLLRIKTLIENRKIT